MKVNLGAQKHTNRPEEARRCGCVDLNDINRAKNKTKQRK